MVVGSVALSFDVLSSAPPATVAPLVTALAADCKTETVTVIAG